MLFGNGCKTKYAAWIVVEIKFLIAYYLSVWFFVWCVCVRAPAHELSMWFLSVSTLIIKV